MLSIDFDLVLDLEFDQEVTSESCDEPVDLAIDEEDVSATAEQLGAANGAAEEGGDEDTAAGAADGVWSPATEGGSLSIRKGMPSI